MKQIFKRIGIAVAVIVGVAALTCLANLIYCGVTGNTFVETFKIWFGIQQAAAAIA